MFEKIDPIDTLPARELKKVRRRASVRYRCHLANPARLSTGEGKPVNGWAHNLSEGGVGLILDLPVETGSDVEIDLYTQAGVKVTLRGRVAHATERPDRSWLVGCELYPALTPDQMEEML
jgi:hypothetical protein